MGKVLGNGRDYSPWDLLLMAMKSMGGSLLKVVDEKELKKRYEGLSAEEKKDLLDSMVQESLAGVGGNVKLGEGMVKKSADIFRHMVDEGTLRKTAAAKGVRTKDAGVVSQDLVKEMEKGISVDGKLTKKFKRMFLSAAPLSPETIYALEKTGSGRQIYRTLDLADQALNRFMVNQVDEFTNAMGKIKVGSKESKRIGQALDGKLDVGKLSKDELRLFKFLKGKFDFLINKYAKDALGSDKKYKKIAGAASSDKLPMAAVKDLSSGLKNKYDKQVVTIAKFLGSRDFKSLKGKELKTYEGMKKELDKIKHEGWLESLDEGERKVFGLLKRKVKNYLPHIFDQNELLKGLEVDRDLINVALGKATSSKEINKLKRRLVSVENSIDKLKGGEMVTYEHLPQNLRFKFFDARKGAQGYSFDAVKAYDSYLRGIGKKLYQEPAVKKVKSLYKDLSPEYRQYVTKHVKDWLGMGRSGAMEMADVVTSLQWMMKLGLNPRSAITNFAQRVNTIAEVGEKNAVVGYLKGWTKQGDELFRRTGLAQEVPSVLLEGQVPKGMERFKNILGWMFTKIEIGNRKGAFLAGVEQAKKMGLKGGKAVQHGIDVVHKTQFRYGNIGMPAPLRTAPGKLGMQFWSYPIKQTEFLVKLLKKNPMKLAKWLVYAEGGRELLEQKAGLDFGNALGLGFNWGEFVEAAKQVPEGDWSNFWKHVRLADSGGGLVPGYSPTVGAGLNVAQGIGRGKGLEALGRELIPVQAKKLSKLYKGVKGAKVVGDKVEVPWYDDKARLDVMLSPGEALTETFGPRLEKLSELNLKKNRKFEFDQMERNLKDEMGVALREGNEEKVNELAEKLLGVGSVKDRIIEREVPWEERYEMKRDRVREELLK